MIATNELVTLPAFSNMPSETLVGRVPQQGYQRGWGLQFGDLSEQIDNNALYREAMAALGEIPTLVDPRKRQNLFLIITHFLSALDSRNIIELGTYRGGNAIFMGYVLQKLDSRAKLYALDTYAGMPTTDKLRDAHNEGDFVDANVEDFRSQLARVGLEDTVSIVQGLFQDTLPPLLDTNVRFGLAHIDCDIYSGVKYSQDAIWPAMCRGGYIAYDDAEVSSCLGATEAVEELIMDRRLHSEQIWPHFVFRVGL